MITPVSTNPNLQRRGPVTERLMRKTTNYRIPNDALGAAPPTPRISLNGPALDHRPIRLQALPDSLQAELVKATEGSQIGRGKGSVEHVEVFPVDSVGTSILEDLDPYPPIAARILTTPSSAKSLILARIIGPHLDDHTDSALTKLARILTGTSHKTDPSKESCLRTHRGESEPVTFEMTEEQPASSVGTASRIASKDNRSCSTGVEHRGGRGRRARSVSMRGSGESAQRRTEAKMPLSCTTSDTTAMRGGSF